MTSHEPYFQTKCFERILRATSDDARRDLGCRLRREAEFVDVPHEAETFWVGANTRPTTSLERIAKGIFDFHSRRLLRQPGVKGVTGSDAIATGGVCSPAPASGAEWWIQIRHDGWHSHLGMPFHWDKDEGLMEKTGDILYPSVSTVTYLTDFGAPTVVLEACASNRGVVVEGDLSRAFVSYPSLFKHLAFDGRFLHGVPENLAREAREARDVSTCQRERGTGCARITLLVNVWMTHKPLGIRPLPSSISVTLSRDDLPVSPRFDTPVDFTPVAFGRGAEGGMCAVTSVKAALGGDVFLEMPVPMPDEFSTPERRGLSAFLLEFEAFRPARVSSRCVAESGFEKSSWQVAEQPRDVDASGHGEGHDKADAGDVDGEKSTALDVDGKGIGRNGSPCNTGKRAHDGTCKLARR